MHIGLKNYETENLDKVKTIISLSPRTSLCTSLYWMYVQHTYTHPVLFP